MLLLWAALLSVAPVQTFEELESSDCRHWFEEVRGTLNSSDPPIRSAHCHWVINAEPEFLVRFTLLDLDITQSVNCSTDFLEVFDGNDPDTKKLMHVCGSLMPENKTVVTTTGSTMLVQLNSNRTQHSNRFVATYEWVCGAVLTASNNKTRFDLERIVVSHLPNCTLTLVAANAGQRVAIVDFQLRGDSEIYVDVSEGLNTTRKRQIFSKPSSEDFINPIVSQGAALHISFVNLPTIYRARFAYFSDSYFCGLNLREGNGTVNSTEYGVALVCQWTIIIPENYLAQFTLRELNIAKTLNCSTNYLEVIDGHSGKVLMRECQLPGNTTVTALNNTMIVRLKSNSAHHNNSFVGSYTGVCGAIIPIITTTVITHIPGHHYDCNCSWTLVDPTGQYPVRLTIYIEILSAKEMQVLPATYVDVWEGEDKTGEYRGRFQRKRVGGFSGRVTSHGVALHIEFVTPPKASWVHLFPSIQKYGPCNRTFTKTAHINAFSFALAEDCVWTFARRGQWKFTLYDLDIDDTMPCSTDYLEVLDGPKPGDKKLMHTCGSQLPANKVFTSTNGTLTVRLKSRSAHHDNFFAALIEMVCGGVVTVPVNSEPVRIRVRLLVNVQCNWTLEAEGTNQHISVRIVLHVSLVSNGMRDGSCVNGYVNVWEISAHTVKPKGRFCLTESHHIVGGVGSSMLIQMVATKHTAFGYIFYDSISAGAPVEISADLPQHSIELEIVLGCVSAVVVGVLAAFVCVRIRRYKKCERGFVVGNLDSIEPEGALNEFAECLPYDKIFEIGREQLRFGVTLGRGDFGMVIKADAHNILPGEPVTTVAVKVANLTKPTALKALVSELKIMVHLGRHLNVVNLLGAHTKNLRNVLVVVEFCRHGDLHSYLSNCRADFVDESNPCTNIAQQTQDLDHPRSHPNCSTSDLFRYAFQVAQGMEFLASRYVVHGDLAARNVLLTEENIVKICDFGLSKNIQEDRENRGKKHVFLPIRWVAIESIRQGKSTSLSDAWSYGVFIWELFSLAGLPYAGVPVHRLLEKLLSGYRLEKPQHATDDIYKVMTDCWHEQPLLRPTFPQLVQIVGSMISEADRQMYIEKNKPYNEMNLARQNESGYYDYLRMFSSSSVYVQMKHTYVNSGEVDEARRSQDSSNSDDIRLQDVPFTEFPVKDLS